VNRALLGAFAALTLAGTAQAAPVIHNSISSFSAISAVQGSQGSGMPVNPTRSVLANMFDANPTTTFFSLGLGGTLELVISPTSNRLISGLAIERTNLPGSNHKEAVEVSLGVNGGGYVLLGEFRNSHIGAGVTNAPGSPATLMFDGAAGSGETARSIFSISGITGNFNTIRFVDISPNNERTNDGFDIAELTLTSDVAGGGDPNVVPTPMALGLFGMALAGLLAARRRH
jgi:hypothetical protein